VRHTLATAVGLTLLAISLWVLARELDRIGFAALEMSLSAVPRTTLIAALAVTALNYFVLTCHDQLAFVYAGVQMHRARIALASFIGYAVSNNVGFAIVSGASARYRFYSRWGVTAGELSRIVTFYSATFWLGLCLIGGSCLLFAPTAGLDAIVPRVVSGTLGAVGLAAVALYGIVCLRDAGPLRISRFEIPLPGRRMLGAQLLVSSMDWMLAASVLYVLLPAPRPPLLLVAGAFAAAQLVALASHVPGGLGVFEGIMLLLLGGNVDAAALAPALLLFRVVYYVIPLGVALIALLVDEGRERRRQLTRWGAACEAVAAWAAPRMLALLTFASGALLLFSGATPETPSRVAWLAEVMPLPLVEASHFAASLTGLLLLLLAQAILRRVDAAMYVTAGALALGAATSLTKGGDYEEASILVAVLLALLAARRHFTRRARIFEFPVSAGWLAAVGTVVAASVWLGFFAYRHVAYTGDLWWRFAVQADAPRFLRASVAVTIAALAFALRQLLAPALPRRAGVDLTATAEIDRVIALQPRAMPYLVYLGDKSLLWNEPRNAFLMYAVSGRSCIALGDPVGPAAAARDLIERFLRMCHEADLTPVLYEATSERLGDFADYGLSAVKIGEDARVHLPDFSLSGSNNKALRSSLNRVEREGLTFRVADPSEAPALIPVLQEISDEWLLRKGASEKGFSLGYFNEEYLRRFPIAVMERDGQIEAFANMWPGPGRVELSPDLMRYRATAPPGIMDVLLVRMMMWARDQGYEWFNIGMAPLSGIPTSPVGRTWTRLGHFVYRNGEAFYNFQGLRGYKEKFHPVWQPRYLAYPGGLALARVIADVTALIAGGYRRIFLRYGRRAA
jgi:phosphatidylglycerol lysyltransferase